MTPDAIKLNLSASINDYKRDKKIPLPNGVVQVRNLPYGKYGRWNLLDVYYPANADKPLPTIVNIHGGGYVYGSKEIYRRYCMHLVQSGFCVVNFNYRLAPMWKFPVPLLDTHSVIRWICKNRKGFHIDPNNLIIVGDSAGAQLASQYAAIATNPSYAKLFGISMPKVTIRALGLNCGMYDLPPIIGDMDKASNEVFRWYFGKDAGALGKKADVLGHITSDFPPAYLISSPDDFLCRLCEPMAIFLEKQGGSPNISKPPCLSFGYSF